MFYYPIFHMYNKWHWKKKMHQNSKCPIKTAELVRIRNCNTKCYHIPNQGVNCKDSCVAPPLADTTLTNERWIFMHVCVCGGGGEGRWKWLNSMVKVSPINLKSLSYCKYILHRDYVEWNLARQIHQFNGNKKFLCENNRFCS